jgi:hypothetical protein
LSSPAIYARSTLSHPSISESISVGSVSSSVSLCSSCVSKQLSLSEEASGDDWRRRISTRPGKDEGDDDSKEKSARCCDEPYRAPNGIEEDKRQDNARGNGFKRFRGEMKNNREGKR